MLPPTMIDSTLPIHIDSISHPTREAGSTVRDRSRPAVLEINGVWFGIRRDNLLVNKTNHHDLPLLLPVQIRTYWKPKTCSLPARLPRSRSYFPRTTQQGAQQCNASSSVSNSLTTHPSSNKLFMRSSRERRVRVLYKASCLLGLFSSLLLTAHQSSSSISLVTECLLILSRPCSHSMSTWSDR